MPDRLVPALELVPEPVVAAVLVGEDPRWLVDVLGDLVGEGVGGHVGDVLGADLALPLHHRQDGRLPGAPPLLLLALVPRLAADVRLVHLNVAGKRAVAVAGAVHGEPDAVHEVEGGLVGEARLPLDFLGGHTLLGRARAPEGVAPDVERDGAVFHDGADADGELPTAVPAPPEVPLVTLVGAALRHLVDIGRSAVRAGAEGVVAPAQFLHQLHRRLLVGAGHWDALDDVVRALRDRCVSAVVGHLGCLVGVTPRFAT